MTEWWDGLTFAEMLRRVWPAGQHNRRDNAAYSRLLAKQVGVSLATLEKWRRGSNLPWGERRREIFAANLEREFHIPASAWLAAIKLSRQLDRMPHKPEPLGCGTQAGYQRHLKRNEPACEPCRATNRRRHELKPVDIEKQEDEEEICRLYGTGQWTQQQLATIFGINQATVSKIVRGRPAMPRVRTLGVCSQCGGPIRQTNMTGICQVNSECQRANRRVRGKQRRESGTKRL